MSINFFVLQYAVPIFLVLVGSITSSREQLASFVLATSHQATVAAGAGGFQQDGDEEKAKENAEDLVSNIIFVFGVITILLGVVNNLVRPAESYDTYAKFNNKFFKFEQEFDLEFFKRGGLPDKPSTNEKQIIPILDFLMEMNGKLAKLIDEYNDARSLSPREANIKALDQQYDEKELASTNSASSRASNDTTGSNPPGGTLGASGKSLDGTNGKQPPVDKLNTSGHG